MVSPHPAQAWTNALFTGRGFDSLQSCYYTGLKTTHVPVSLLPVDTVPLHRFTQARASSYYGYSLVYELLFLRCHQTFS